MTLTTSSSISSGWGSSRRSLRIESTRVAHASASSGTPTTTESSCSRLRAESAPALELVGVHQLVLHDGRFAGGPQRQVVAQLPAAEAPACGQVQPRAEATERTECEAGIHDLRVGLHHVHTAVRADQLVDAVAPAPGEGVLSQH